MVVKILMIDDEEKICKQISELLHKEKIKENTIHFEYVTNFDEGADKLSMEHYDLVILDLYKGKPDEFDTEKVGEVTLEKIKTQCFVPVVFFSGLVNPILHLESDVIKVVRKSDGINALKGVIENIIETGIPMIKQKVFNYLNEASRTYFWNFVHTNWAELKNIKDDISLGYLLIRRFANALTKEKVISLLDDPKLKPDKVHPMEFYIYPHTGDNYVTGSILKKDEECFVVLTPSCDFAQKKADYTLLVRASLLSDKKEYSEYKTINGKMNNNEKEKRRNKLLQIIQNRKGDRYYFLPEVPFIENSVLDFQNTLIIKTEDITSFEQLAKLDNPFAESMLASFTRYYNRVGHDDLDSDYILKNISKE